MLKLKHDIINVGCVNWSIGRGRKPKPSQVWSIKSINIYGFEDKYFFSNPYLKRIYHLWNHQKERKLFR